MVEEMIEVLVSDKCVGPRYGRQELLLSASKGDVKGKLNLREDW